MSVRDREVGRVGELDVVIVTRSVSLRPGSSAESSVYVHGSGARVIVSVYLLLHRIAVFRYSM